MNLYWSIYYRFISISNCRSLKLISNKKPPSSKTAQSDFKDKTVLNFIVCNASSFRLASNPDKLKRFVRRTW